jgi:hypothetical protein
MRFDGFRHWCSLCELPGADGEYYRKALYVGAGCCSPMNSDRKAAVFSGQQDVSR